MEDTIQLLKRIHRCAEADENGDAVHTSDFFSASEVQEAIITLESQVGLMSDS